MNISTTASNVQESRVTSTRSIVRDHGHEVAKTPPQSGDAASSKTAITVGEAKDFPKLELKGQNIQFNPGSGDRLILSDEARAIMERKTAQTANGTAQPSSQTLPPAPATPSQGTESPIVPPVSTPLQATGQAATTSQGTTVTLDTTASPALNFTSKNGENLSLSLKAGEDLHIKETATGLSVLNKTTGAATQFNFDGSQSALEDTFSFTDMSGDDIIVNMTQKSVNAGNGNDIVVNFADNAKISTGEGNDALMLGNKTASGLEVDMGEGNNRVTGGELKDSNVTAGNGRNDIDVAHISNTPVNLATPGKASPLSTPSEQKPEQSAKPNPTLPPVQEALKLEEGASDAQFEIQPDDARKDIQNTAMQYPVAEDIATPNFETTTTKGTTVKLSHGHDMLEFTSATGQNLSVNINNSADMHIKETENGLAVRNARTNTTDIYKFDGSVESINDTSLFADMSGDDIIVNKTQSTVNAGNGNDIIINFVDNATITGGAGNDTLMLAGRRASGITADMGEGDDVVHGTFVSNSNISLGNGNDRLSVVSAGSTHIDAGEGDNSIGLNGLGNDSTLTAGDGNNRIVVENLSANGNIIAGNGNNRVAVGNVQYNSSISLGHGNNNVRMGLVKKDSTIDLGNGNNTLGITVLEGNASVKVGNGNNISWMQEVSNNATLEFGNGNNTYSVHGVSNGAEVNFGNGNNKVYALELNDGHMTFGNGDSSVMLYGFGMKGKSSLKVGSGDNNLASIIVDSDSTVQTGNGNNKLYIGGLGGSVKMGNGNNNVRGDVITNDADVALGNGDNTVQAEQIRNATISMGNGNNDVSAAVMRRGAKIYAGNGNNEIKAGVMRDTQIDLGNGNNELKAGAVQGSEIRMGNGNNTTIVWNMTNSALNFGDGGNRIGVGNVFGSTISTGGGKDSLMLGLVAGSTVSTGGGKDTVVAGKVTDSSIDTGDGDDTLVVNSATDSVLAPGNGNNYEVIGEVITTDKPANDE